jgi:hypothetical protein
MTLFSPLNENDMTLGSFDKASAVTWLVSVYRAFKETKTDLIIACTLAAITLTYDIDQTAYSRLVNQEKFQQGWRPPPEPLQENAS